MKILCGQLNVRCTTTFRPCFTFALRMTRASSRNIGKLYTEHQVVHKESSLFLYILSSEHIDCATKLLKTVKNLLLLSLNPLAQAQVQQIVYFVGRAYRPHLMCF